jgi:hypothetical protein
MPYTDIEALAAIEKIFADLADEKSKIMVSYWLFQKYGGATPQAFQTPESGKLKKTRTKKKAAGNKKQRASSKPDTVGNLNLRPEGKQTFIDFVKEKEPSNNWEKGTVAIFYLTRILGLEKAGLDHVYTCFLEASWRLPANIGNTLQVAASKQRWLDTSSMDDIRMTARGENLVKLDLPKMHEPR